MRSTRENYENSYSRVKINNVNFRKSMELCANSGEPRIRKFKDKLNIIYHHQNTPRLSDEIFLHEQQPTKHQNKTINKSREREMYSHERVLITSKTKCIVWFTREECTFVFLFCVPAWRHRSIETQHPPSLYTFRAPVKITMQETSLKMNNKTG